jgi:hypothetical protein
MTLELGACVGYAAVGGRTQQVLRQDGSTTVVGRCLICKQHGVTLAFDMQTAGDIKVPLTHC